MNQVVALFTKLNRHDSKDVQMASNYIKILSIFSLCENGFRIAFRFHITSVRLQEKYTSEDVGK